MTQLRMTALAILWAGICSGNTAVAFDHGKVLPDGVRRFSLTSLHTTISHKSDHSGHLEPIARPLEKDLDLAKVLKGESGIRQKSLQALMLHEGLTPQDSLGTFSADMQGKVAVTVPQFFWGITDRLTLAFALPWYEASIKVEPGFNINHQNVRKLTKILESKGQYQALQDLSGKLNQAVGELQRKLREHGYQELRDWNGRGVGDLILAGKYQFLQGDFLRLASTSGITVPTGRVSDPDILNDIPFGQGSWIPFTALIADQCPRNDVFFNQYVKLSYPLPGRKVVRLITEEESLEVEKQHVVFQTGAGWEAGTSVQYESRPGLLAGLGYIASKKSGDRYRTKHHLASETKLEKDSHRHSQHWEAMLGYSSVRAYQKGDAKVPLILAAEYKRHIASINSTNNDYVSINMSLFF